MTSDRIARSRSRPASVYVHEILDPTGQSLEWLADRGVKVERGVTTWSGQRLDEDEIIARGAGHVALMGASTHHITRNIMEALPNLAFISKYGIGVDAIDVRAATDLGVLVTNTPVAENVEAVAEWTVASMLMLRKQLTFYTTERMRAGGWRTPEAWGSFMWRHTIGFVGYGRIAKAVARRLQGWDMRMLAYDPYVKIDDPLVEQVSYEQLLYESDIVSIHAIATSDNLGLVDGAALARMKPSAVLINSARGSLLNLDDVRDALVEGRLAGLAVDAYASEPPEIDHPIFTLPNVIATPHASAWVAETFERISQVGAENVWAAMSGKTPAHVVNAEVLSG